MDRSVLWESGLKELAFLTLLKLWIGLAQCGSTLSTLFSTCKMASLYFSVFHNNLIYLPARCVKNLDFQSPAFLLLSTIISTISFWVLLSISTFGSVSFLPMVKREWIYWILLQKVRRLSDGRSWKEQVLVLREGWSMLVSIVADFQGSKADGSLLEGVEGR